MKHIREILKESVFGALFTLWTAPIDDRKRSLRSYDLKLNIDEAKSGKKASWFLNNLIVGHKIGT